ncbi:phosphoenolpyruvate--protein phosphotransferase [Falsiroseomonas stagni]|uniref:phosphoenolpyruvate--protein phosphotransferase n=1 Tax=Falsiroseomonas stagni DSM 19981 TaxID=1123062 RepID=A0A1I4DKU6_9PROT|nr:phosphoenolpyruvate--protein phosphotransferase [Falsiroseomonas stagni]SFK92997.1 phosphocarrier protein FPr [Falsiroseomonas stagni DSM 19981]
MAQTASVSPSMAIAPELVRLDAHPADKHAAIQQLGQLLAAAGCVDPGYAASMEGRERAANTFLGHGVAIPHGLAADRHLVRRNGLAILQVRDGIEWNPGQRAHLIVGIAATSDEHIAILRRLTRLMQDEAALARLFTVEDPAAIIAALGAEAPEAPAAAATDFAERVDWVLDYPSGLHARPATRWVETARATGARIQVRHGVRAADASALIALLQLGLRPGDALTISAEGRDAAAALARFRATIAGLSAQEKADAALAARRATTTARGFEPTGRVITLAGIGASPGLAIGRIHLLAAQDAAIPDQPLSLAEGGARLEHAIRATRAQLKALEDDTARRLGAADAAIFTAQAGLLDDDPDLITTTCQLMVEGHGLAWSWHQAVGRVAASLSALGNPVLAGRAADLRDVGRRVLGQIDPSLAGGSLADLPEGKVILVAEDLSPSDTAGLDPDRVVGLATATGGPTSHTAILARTLGVPALVAGGAGLLDLKPGTEAIIDGTGGRLHLDPTEADLAAARAFIARQAERRARQEALRAEPATTRDGTRIEVAANINLPDQAAFALAQGAEGVGLMRTEFLFLESGVTPDEDSQFATYRAMIEAVQGKPLIVRALDIGGDKQVPHLRLPVEANPFLGVRGARLLLRRPDLMEPQLRALYRAAKEGGALSIMFPMVTSVQEVIALRAACDRIRAAIGAPEIPIGIMVEVPAAAVQADALARHVDFFSIGTNDLTQYVLAMDRQNPDLAAEADSLHPAVLRMIAMTVQAADRAGKWTGVCGGLAGDPFGAALLAGLGVRELSMTPRDIPAVKSALRGATLSQLQALSAQALDCATADEVRALEATLAPAEQEAA